MNNSHKPINPVGNLFARISGVYDLLNHVLSFGIDRQWRKELAKIAKPQTDAPILDLAAGTLDVSLQLAQNYPGNIYSLDFCLPMLRRGLSKIKRARVEKRIFPICGDALALPFRNNQFASVTIAFGIRNILKRVEAFREMARVLQPGGKVCILEFGTGKEKIWGGAYNFYLAKILPQIGLLMGKDKSAYSYLAETIRNFPNASVLEEELTSAGFVKTGWKKLTSGIVYIHWGEKSALA